MNNKSVLPLEAICAFMSDKLDVEILVGKNRIAGKIVGLDEYMNLVVDQAGERMVVKGECIVAVVPKSTTPE